MGLTGLIVEVTLRLQPVESAVDRRGDARAWRASSAMLDGPRASARRLAVHRRLDRLPRARARGSGAASSCAGATPPATRRPGAAAARGRRSRVPMDAPEWLLSPLVHALLQRPLLPAPRRPRCTRRVGRPTSGFFYPLDAIGDWNRLYGRRGFLQYQCVLPRAAGAAPLAAILERLAAAGAASFLAVIKDCGPGSDAYLSFPMEGTTLALDLPYRGAATRGPRPRAERACVIARGGRVYLAKDAVTRAEDFARMMPRARRVAGGARPLGSATHRFRSAQSVAAPRGPRVKVAFVGATRGMGRALARRARRARRRALPARAATRPSSRLSARDLEARGAARAGGPRPARPRPSRPASPKRSTRPTAPWAASTRWW